MGELIPRVFRAFQGKIPIGIRGEIPIGITFTGEIPIGFFRVSFLRGKSLGFFKGVKSEKAYRIFPLEVGRCPPSQPRGSGIHHARPPPRPGARKKRRLIRFFPWI